MNQRDIENLIIELLATSTHRDPADLREELEALGEELPVDSLLAAEVLAQVEDHYGISFPASAETARCLTSVTAFALAVQELLHERGIEVGQTA